MTLTGALDSVVDTWIANSTSLLSGWLGTVIGFTIWVVILWVIIWAIYKFINRGN